MCGVFIKLLGFLYEKFPVPDPNVGFIRRDSDKPIDIIKLMLKYVHAVKEKFRQFDRPLREISAIHFEYR